jgi:hypothetical protein
LKVDKKNITDIWNNFIDNIAPKFNKKLGKDIIMYLASSQEVIDILKNQPNNFNENNPEYLSKFIELCNREGYLTNWTIALKTTGSSKPGLSKGELGLSDSIDITNVQLARRSGPKSYDDVTKFIKYHLFKASSKSANIISSNKDMAILLNENEKVIAEETFYKFKAKEFLKKDNALTLEEALSKAKTQFKTIPERYYRAMMKENEGLLMIYLFDSEYAFNQSGNNSKIPELKSKFKTYINDNKIDIKVPLVGYAIEFPPIENDPGGIYIKGDYDLIETCDTCGEIICTCKDSEDEFEGIIDSNEI